MCGFQRWHRRAILAALLCLTPALFGCDKADDRPVYSCTVAINCETILDQLDRCKPEKRELVPQDGWILQEQTVEFREGDSAFDVLERVCRENKIHLETSQTPLYNSVYIEGIHNIYEFDVGSGSGWMFRVNDEFLNYSCSAYPVAQDDVICWVYTCDYGEDIGGRFVGNVEQTQP